MIKSTIIIILFFIYLFPVRLVFFPTFLSTRWFFFFVGLFCLAKKLLTNTNGLLVSHNGAKYISSFLLLWIYICISIFLINSTRDLYLITYPLSILVIAIAAYGLVKMVSFFHRKDTDTNSYFSQIIIGTIILECFLSVILYFSPSLQNIWYSIITMEGSEAVATANTQGSRLQGVGVTFFGAGVACCIGLLFTIFKLVELKTFKEVILYITVFIFIVIIGSGLARTTQAGAALACIYFLVSRKSLTRLRKNTIYVIFGGFCFCIIAIILYFKYVANNPLLELVAQHAFEAIYNLFDSGDLTTSSSEKMFEMYRFPDNIKSWFWGDGYFIDPITPPSYYKGTDIGYCRLIFYVGIIGLMMYLLIQIRLICMTSLPKLQQKFLILLFFMLMMKGMTDLSAYIFPFIFGDLIYGKKKNCNFHP